MNAELLIAGIPATEWIGRRARFWGHENKQHPTPCLIKGIDNNRKVVILPIGHKKNEIVDPEAIAPTWKNNDDLRQKYAAQINVSVVEDPPEEESAETPNSLVSELGEVDPIPQLQQPKMVIHNHTLDWMPTYQSYREAVDGETTDRALLREVVKSINTHRATQARCIEQLLKMGVEISVEIKSESKVQPTELLPTFEKNRRRGRIEMDRYIIDWGKSLRSKMQSGARVKGTINAWADELGITWLAVQSRITMLNDIVGLTFTDARGRSGSKARGTLTVGLRRS